MRWRRPLGLRARAAVGFGLIGLLTSIVLASTTYFAVRAYLLDQRETTAERQAFANARLTRNALRSEGVDVATLLTTIRGSTGSDVVARVGDGWFASSVATGEDSVPLRLRQLAAEGHAGRQRVRGADGELRLVVGTPLAAVDAAYFEIFHLDDLEDILDLLRGVLIGAGAATVLGAAAVGRLAAGRVMEPLGPVATAASRIADGQLEARLPASPDPDLAELTGAFNAMAGSLEARIERERRFASDVSHELRTPLAAVKASLEVIQRRRAELPESVTEALDILQSRTVAFESLVLELLEISRFDAATVEPQLEPIDLGTFIDHTIRAHAGQPVPVRITDVGHGEVIADRRRLAPAIGNLIRNAERYAGGVDELAIEADDETVRFLVDDRGPGVDPPERDAIFQRFNRGAAGRRAGPGTGTGLGLSLASAQVELHGGRIWVTDRPGQGGARFVIEIPRRGPA